MTKIKYSYDSNNNLIAVEYPLGRNVCYEYNNHLLVKETDPGGNNIYWAYNKSHRCIKTWRDGGILFRDLAFDDYKKSVKATNSLGFTTVYRCDDKNNVVSKTDPLGETIQNAYDEHGNLMGSTDGGAGNQEVSFFDENTNCLTETNSKGVSIRYYFNDRNSLVRVADDDGNEWLKDYDDQGRVIRSAAPEGVEWKFEYAPQGYVRKAVNPLGHSIYQERSADGRVIKLKDDLGAIIKNAYDREGNLVSITNAEGRKTRFVYDEAGRLISIISHDGNVRKSEYDANNNLIASIDEMGQTFHYEYDIGGKPIKETSPLGRSLSLEYDTEQQLVGLRNWKGEKATISNDPIGRPLEANLFDGRVQRYEYDSASNLIAVSNTSGDRTAFEYEVGELTKKVFPDGKEIQYDFRDGFLRFASNGDSSISREFDSRLRLIKEECGNWSITYTYDAMDNLTRVEDCFGHVVSYSYDQRRRVTHMYDSQIGTYKFTYNLLDLLVELRLPNDFSQEMEYDEHDRLKKISVIDPSGKEILRRGFDYDVLDRLIRQVVQQKGLRESTTSEYRYNPLHQLTQVIRNGSIVDWYEYDPNGNIVRCADFDSIEIGSGNQLLKAGGIRFEYDREGNLVDRHQFDETVRYYYNSGGELVKILHPDDSVTEFRYDPVGRRVGKIHNGKETRYYWNNDTLCREEYDEGAKQYLFLPSSFIPIGITSNEQSYYVLFDQIATPTELLDSSGQIAWSRNANVWGQDVSDSRESNLCPLRFQGQYRDRETKLHYNYFRYYAPDIARYITQDPIGLSGGANFYRYVTNPLTWVDPFALFEIVLKARCDWNDEQIKDFKKKVKRYNEAIEEKQDQGQEGITISPCPRGGSAKKLYEKCENPKGNPKKKSPKDGGKAVDCKDDIDHIIDCQMGGAQNYPDVCKNLVPVNASVNRSIGSQISNQIKGRAGQVLEGVGIGERECPDKTPRTPACT